MTGSPNSSTSRPSKRRRVIVSIVVLAVVGVIAVIVIALLGQADAAQQDASPTATTRSEVPESGEATNPPLPLPDGERPLVTTPLPESGSAEGEFVDGFPQEIIPLAPNSEIESTSLAVEGDREQVGLVAVSTGAASAVVDFYRSVFGSLGLTERETDAVPGSTGLVFTRGADNITLTVADGADGANYTVVGVFTAK